MEVRKIGYLVIIILAFVLGLQMDMNFETSQIVNSDDIAIVNNDQRVDYMEQSLKFGDEIVKQIDYMDTNYNYTVVSSAQASQGLVSGKYAAVITIPSNLTTSILSINTDAPVATTINYELNSRLTNKSKEKIERELNSILGTSQNNLTYMYVYSIFDSLHDTQEGIEVVTENAQPVYDFLEQLLEINVVTNHEYELKENNNDTFSIIDLSEQLSEFNQIITSYKQEIQDVISLYKIENSESSQIINAQISKYEENTEGLNDNIDNVEDTLQTLVDSNEPYTEDEFSITDTRSDIQKILESYYSQLTELNTINKTNEQLNIDSEEFKESYEDLKERTPYKFYNQLLTNRNEYYSQVNEIDQCLSSSDIEACLATDIDLFTSEYSDYESLLERFEQEKQYAETLSYYIRHIGSDEVKKSDDSETFEIESKFENIETEQMESEIEEPVITVTKYQTVGHKDDYLLLNVDNTKSDVESLTIDINKTNISNIESQSLTVSDLDITNNSILIEDLEPTRYSYLLKIAKDDPTKESKLSITYGDQSSLIITPPSDVPIDFDYTYDADELKMLVDVDYLVENSDTLTYVNTNLISYVDSASIIDQSIADSTTLTSDGFTIDTEDIELGTTISFSLEINLNTKLGNGIFVDTYTINDNNYETPIIVNEGTISTKINLYDDPYYRNLTSDEIEKVDNDLEAGDPNITTDDYIVNSTIEPEEEVGIKYSVEYTTSEPTSIEQLEFDLTSSEFVEEITEDDIVGVEFNRDNIAYNASITDETLTINILETPIIEVDDDGLYTYDFSIYMNAQAISDIIVASEKDSLVISSHRVKLVTDTYQNEYYDFASDDIDLSWGQIEPIVKYSVGEDTCNADIRKLSDCEFEAGEEVERQIIISNPSNKPAAGITIGETFDKSIIDYVDSAVYQLEGIDTAPNLSDELANDYIATYSEQTAEKTVTFNVSLPANSTLTITNTLKIDEYISDEAKVDIVQNFKQYGINEMQANKTITLFPIILELSDLEANQVVNDGIVTEDEALKLSFKLKNSSSRGVSKYNNVVITNNISGIIDQVEVMSVEDEDWNDVDYTSSVTSDNLIINVNKDIKPGQSVRMEIKVIFNDLKSATSSTGAIKIQSFKDSIDKPDYSSSINTELQYDYTLSGASYLELARDQLANREVVPGEKYIDSYQETSQTINDRSQLDATISSLNKYIFKYNDYYQIIDSFTELDNTAISIIKIQLSKFGLGYEDKDDEDYIAIYDYCVENNELSCKIINLYNKIYTIEDEDKAYFATLLNLLDPSIEETIGTKVDSDGNETDDPTNIGADFNGTNTCEETDLEVDSEIDSDSKPQSADCIEAEPGIWNRIDIQKQDIEVLEDDIDLILDNDVKEVDEEPYKESLAGNSQEMNKIMDNVESENNQLFDTKIDIYNDNYSTVLEYLQEVAEDESYIDAVDKFKEEEDARQLITNEILVHTYELMPNTYLNGMPNKLVYSFIANPLNIESNTESNILAATTADNEFNMLYIYIGGFLTLVTVVMGAVFYKINKGV